MKEIQKKVADKTFKRSNAAPVLREVYTSRDGTKISLIGRHGFDWSVTESKYNTHAKVMTFSNRIDALNEYRTRIKNYKLMNGY